MIQLLSVTQAAKMLKVSTPAFLKLLETGKTPPPVAVHVAKLNRLLFFERESFTQWASGWDVPKIVTSTHSAEYYRQWRAGERKSKDAPRKTVNSLTARAPLFTPPTED